MGGLQAMVNSCVEKQGSCLAVINTPAHNPTGYSLSTEEWREVVGIFNEATAGGGTATIFVDAAYIDFAGDPDEYRQFLPEFEKLNDNVMVIIGYSASKTFTLYGMGLLIFWMLAAFHKDIITGEAAKRMMWYLYYVPALLMPVLGLSIALQINGTEPSLRKKIISSVYSISWLLM